MQCQNWQEKRHLVGIRRNYTLQGQIKRFATTLRRLYVDEEGKKRGMVTALVMFFDEGQRVRRHLESQKQLIIVLIVVVDVSLGNRGGKEQSHQSKVWQ